LSALSLKDLQNFQLTNSYYQHVTREYKGRQRNIQYFFNNLNQLTDYIRQSHPDSTIAPKRDPLATEYHFSFALLSSPSSIGAIHQFAIKIGPSVTKYILNGAGESNVNRRCVTNAAEVEALNTSYRLLLTHAQDSLLELQFDYCDALKVTNIPSLLRLHTVRAKYNFFHCTHRPHPSEDVRLKNGFLLELSTKIPAILKFEISGYFLPQRRNPLAEIFQNLVKINPATDLTLGIVLDSGFTPFVRQLYETSSPKITKLEVRCFLNSEELCITLAHWISTQSQSLKQLRLRDVCDGDFENDNNVVFPPLPVLESFHYINRSSAYLPFTSIQFPNLQTLSTSMEGLKNFRPLESVKTLCLGRWDYSVGIPPGGVNVLFPNVESLTLRTYDRCLMQIAFTCTTLTHLKISGEDRGMNNFNASGWAAYLNGRQPSFRNLERKLIINARQYLALKLTRRSAYIRKFFL